MDNPLSKVLTNTPPPPPLEVKIRTMHTDIDSMMKSGGGAPSFQNVPVAGLTMEGYKAPTSAPTPMPNLGSFSVPAAPVAVPTISAADLSSTPAIPAPTGQEFVPEETSNSNLVPIVIVMIVAIIAIAVVGYFAYTIFK